MVPQNNPLLSMLGICRAAGKLSIGSEASTAAVKSGKARLVVIAGDISQKTEKELRYAAKDSDIPIIRINETLLELSRAIGIKAGVVSVNDAGLAGAVQSRCRNTGEEISL